eukprot:1813349-Pleurochrysis_carterae.AAC.1
MARSSVDIRAAYGLREQRLEELSKFSAWPQRVSQHEDQLTTRCAKVNAHLEAESASVFVRVRVRQPAAGGRRAAPCGESICVRASSRVARKAGTSFVGSFWMKPTVSESSSCAGRERANAHTASKWRERGAEMRAKWRNGYRVKVLESSDGEGDGEWALLWFFASFDWTSRKRVEGRRERRRGWHRERRGEEGADRREGAKRGEGGRGAAEQAAHGEGRGAVLCTEAAHGSDRRAGVRRSEKVDAGRARPEVVEGRRGEWRKAAYLLARGEVELAHGGVKRREEQIVRVHLRARVSTELGTNSSTNGLSVSSSRMYTLGRGWPAQANACFCRPSNQHQMQAGFHQDCEIF